MIHIILGKKAVAFGIAVWFNNIEFFFVKPYKRSVNLKHISYLAYAIIKFSDGFGAKSHINFVQIVQLPAAFNACGVQCLRGSKLEYSLIQNQVNVEFLNAKH